MNERTDLEAFALPHGPADSSVTLQRVPCTVCQHEVPISEALVAEATDYLMYFCGLDCYARWRNQLADR